MRLESLEIAGFKSFADPVLLEFPETITVVVGPNGSGKSNVVDAIKWVLGEQSARHLRCTRMEELIFSGSASRRRLGMAEVVAGFRDGGDEISIARRIDRSGRSDYRINGRRCRLRDVQDLFFDTGLGRSSYAVIGQGEVERIVEAGGEEIRAYVEEVAGVERHRVQMSRIDRHLESAREDLRRLDDVIVVRREYLEPLREQAKRARLHRLLGRREESLRVQVAEADLRRAAAGVDKLEKREAEIAARLRESGRTQRELDRKLHDTRAERKEISGRRKLLQRGRDNLVRGRDSCRARRAVLRERRRSLQSSRAQAQKALEEAEEAREELKSGRAGDKSIEAMREELEALEEERDEFRRERDSLVARVEWLRGVVRRADGLASNLRIRRRALENDMESVDRQLGRAFTRASRARDREVDDERSGEQDGAEETIREFEGCRRKLQSRRASREADLQKQEEERERWSERVKILRDRLARWEARAETLSELSLADAAPRETGASAGEEPIFAQQLRVPEGLEGAVEAALGRWLDARLEEAENSIPDGVRVFPAVMDDNLARPPLRRWQRERRRWETWCVRHGFGDSVVGWLDELIQRQEQHPRARTSAAYFLNAYLVVRDRGALREIAEELWRGHHRVEHPIELAPPHLITPGGDLADPGGGIAPVDRSEKESAERVRRGAEIRRLQSAVVEAGEQLAEAEKMRGTADRQCAQLRRELEELSEKEREVRGQLQLHRAEQDRRERERRRREDERRELEESSEQISELEKEKADIERQMLRSERAEAELSAHRRRTRKRLEPLESRLEEVESSLNEAEHGRISLRERIDSEQRRRRDLDREAERVDRQLHHWRSSLRDYADELEEAIRREADLSEREAAFDAAVERTDRQFRTVLERDQCAAETEEQLRARLDRLREDREELERDASRIEVQLARAQTRYEQVEREVREVGLDPESVGGQKDPPGERRLARMRRDLSRIEARRRELEPVNPLSIGEYRREARQLLGLQGQRDDISSALAGLRELSADARRQLDVRFKENLRATSSAFHRTFSDLFEGGQAELRLRGDSLWDGRVEMRVQPPGKKLTRLSLLSGGERALAGIAFLFALLNMRPAPICVFDEIDAALDEANTDRFARYVQRWRDEAQYLLITHQKQTMEIADAMHGVTMSEPGVSELVSVRLQGRDEPEVADAAAEGNGEGTT